MKVKVISAVVAATSLVVVPLAGAGPISVNTLPLSYSQSFDGLGSGNVAWSDGNTLEGWYLLASASGYANDTVTPDGIPDQVNASIGNNTSPTAYHFGGSGSSERALGWITGSTTSTAFTGVQFRNLTGSDRDVIVNVSMTIEQWKSADTNNQDIELQWKASATGGNILTSSTWTSLDTGTGPNLTNTNAIDGNLSGNQFDLSGIFTFNWISGQHLTFRLIDPNHSGGDHAFGVDDFNITISVVPEPASMALLGLGGLLMTSRRGGRS